MRSVSAQKGRIQQKASVFQIKPSQFRVIARPQSGRGNLKAEGMASHSEARCPFETDFKHFGNKNGRFYCKTYHFCVIARSQRGRGNLKAEGMASRGEAPERKTTKSRIVDPSRSDTTAALRRKRYFTQAQACISRAQHLSHDQRSYFTAQLWPCFVPGYRLVPSKIATSGARALLAMTNLIGFAGKRNGFQNETLEKRCGASPRRKAA